MQWRPLFPTYFLPRSKKAANFATTCTGERQLAIPASVAGFLEWPCLCLSKALFPHLPPAAGLLRNKKKTNSGKSWCGAFCVWVAIKLELRIFTPRRGGSSPRVNFWSNSHPHPPHSHDPSQVSCAVIGAGFNYAQLPLSEFESLRSRFLVFEGRQRKHFTQDEKRIQGYSPLLFS